jgi:16S rRNA (uracil1498-N3)-methyltransferase
MSKIPGLHLPSLPTPLPQNGSIVELAGKEAHHLLRVLRTVPDDELYLGDGIGTILTARVLPTSHKDQLKVLVTSLNRATPPPTLTVVFPLIRRERMEWGMEKLAEIGVRRIIPCRFDHSDSSRGRLRSERLEQRLREGCRQSGNPWLPELAAVTDFDQLLTEEFPIHQHLYWGAVDGNSIAAVADRPAPDQTVLLLTGPEGGFSGREMAMLSRQEHGQPLQLGRYILRAETAALLLAASVNDLVASR